MASGGRIQGCPEGEAAQQCSPALTTAVKGSRGPDRGKGFSRTVEGSECWEAPATNKSQGFGAGPAPADLPPREARRPRPHWCLSGPAAGSPVCPNHQRPRREQGGGRGPCVGSSCVAGCVSRVLRILPRHFFTFSGWKMAWKPRRLVFALRSSSVVRWVFCFVLISVAAERHPGQRATQVPVGAAALLHGHLLLRGACASGCYADASGRRGRERTGAGEGEAVALAMTGHRRCPASLSPGHFALCGPLPP